MHNLTRRQFLRSTALAAGMAAAQHVLEALAVQHRQPNILLIMPDQMRGDCLSILGHPAVRTPNMDKLARNGVLFRRAYTPVASCIPARYALLSGLYPQTSGVVGFRAKPFATPTLPALLAGSGYQTVLVGRNMHQPDESGDCGYQRRILGSTYVAEDDYDRFLKQNAPETGGIRNLVKEMDLTYNHWQARPWPLDDSLHPTAWIVDQSRQVVQQADQEQPLFLTTSFYAPHPPLFAPKKYFDHYAKQTLPSPAKGDWVKWDELTPEGDRPGHRVLLQGETLHNAQAGYYGLIEHLDHEIADLIKAFKRKSQQHKRPWIIIVTSDHGEMMGDHGYFRKCEPYEGSANIPFIFTASSELAFKTGRKINQPVCLEDIMPTLLEIAGILSPAPVDGISLLSTLRGQNQRIREWLHFEHATCYSKAQAYHALTDGKYKYIWRPLNGEEQLFDLEADPQEEHDLSADSSRQTTLREWRERLTQRLANRPEGFVQKGRLIAGQDYPPLNKGFLSP
jgi:arylsulfatase A-like enzyme